MPMFTSSSPSTVAEGVTSAVGVAACGADGDGVAVTGGAADSTPQNTALAPSGVR